MTIDAPEFFSEPWADAVRQALQAGPSAEVRAAALPEYWNFVDRIRSTYRSSWAIGVRDLPGRVGPSYLYVEWADNDVVDCRLSDARGTQQASYVLTGGYAHWHELLAGSDARRAIMYRKILMDEGNLLEFFRTIYFFIEYLAVITRIDTSKPTAPEHRESASSAGNIKSLGSYRGSDI